MPSPQNFVIVGASLAGAKAAETLRSEGFEGRVILLGEEPVRPYERPPLSKGYLRGEDEFDSAAVHQADFYDTQGIELRTSTVVTGIDPRSSEIELLGGERIRYDQLLVATGASPRRLSIPGSELAGIHYLRSVADSDALRQAINTAVPVVVIGAGWIGAEVAASARQLGAEVALVELESVPLKRVLGEEVGKIYKDLHAEHEVKLHFGVGIESFRGTSKVEEVVLGNGTTLPAGVVVVGVGVAPRTELAQAAGLALDNGIVTDEHLASSIPGIFAAGDVANVFYPAYGQHIRLEHWSAALNQGPIAAKNMLGKNVAYDKIPFFYSDQYEFGMEYRGWAPAFDKVVLRGDVSRREFIAFWIRHGKVAAAMNANIWDQGDAIEALIRAGRPVDAGRLADASIDLANLGS
ncbi:NAD(P)/FAD-dependent oxidoreductase [bacterium]|nr:MAG: NAD(P)/FAD-dependent oxidoreductase [bacterium]